MGVKAQSAIKAVAWRDEAWSSTRRCMDSSFEVKDDKRNTWKMSKGDARATPGEQEESVLIQGNEWRKAQVVYRDCSEMP
jgi:hypothetical protein